MNILTFDIEDWFHTHQNRQRYSGHIWRDLPSKVADNTDRILNMLDASGLKATFFVLGWVARYYPDVVRKIYDKGHEIASHSYWHHNPHLLSPEDFEKDMKLSLDVLQDITGSKVSAYRAPGFNLRLKDYWAFEILATHGITVDSSVQLRPFPEEIPLSVEAGGKTILEFPLVTTRIGLPYSGGGYFRALPMILVSRLFSQRDYHLLYFHPRDFDPENPSVNFFSFWRNRMNNINTDRCLEKLENVISNYKTMTMGEAAKTFLEKNKC